MNAAVNIQSYLSRAAYHLSECGGKNVGNYKALHRVGPIQLSAHGMSEKVSDIDRLHRKLALLCAEFVAEEITSCG